MFFVAVQVDSVTNVHVPGTLCKTASPEILYQMALFWEFFLGIGLTRAKHGEGPLPQIGHVARRVVFGAANSLFPGW